MLGPIICGDPIAGNWITAKRFSIELELRWKIISEWSHVGDGVDGYPHEATLPQIKWKLQQTTINMKKKYIMKKIILEQITRKYRTWYHSRKIDAGKLRIKVKLKMIW